MPTETFEAPANTLVTEGNTTGEPSGDHVEKMLAKAEAGTGVAVTPEETLLAGKYKTETDLKDGLINLLTKDGKSLEEVYKTFESDVGKPKEVGLEIPKEEKPNEEALPKVDETPKDGTKETPSGKLELDKYTTEFSAEGTLSKASYTELENLGLPPQMVDAYIAGLKASAAQQASEIYEVVGGPESYQQIVSWATESLSPEEVTEFNNIITTGNSPAIKLAVRGLKQSYSDANGSPPKNLIKGTAPSVGNAAGYGSMAEMKTDMRDPRYKSDEAFRNTVQARLRNSDF
jgi:hypothetical protein